MPLVTDLTRNARLEEVAGGTEVSRTFRVSGIIDAAYEILFTGANWPGIPSIGDAYPGLNSQFRCKRKSAVPDGAGHDVLVVCTYSDKTGPTWNQVAPEPVANDGVDVKQMSTSLVDTKRDKDINGTTMLVNSPASAGPAKSNISIANVKRPAGMIVFERVEVTPPAQRTRNMVGKTNSVQVGVYLSKSLLFSRIDAQSVDGGRVWRVTYEFTYDSAGFWHRDWYRRADGKVPDDATEHAWNIYEEVDFNTLGLDFSDNQTPLP